jgi:hypothetical protein
MKTLLSLAVFSGLAVLGTAALAEDTPAATTPLAVTAATAATISTPVTTTAVPKTTAQTAKPVMDELKDGTKIEIGTDGTVSIMNADGTKTTAPDGVLTLKDQTTFGVKDGKKMAN